MDEPWRKQLEDMDVEVLGAQTMAEGAKWPAIALAAALIDSGAIEKLRLLEIIDALHGFATVKSLDRLGEPQDAVLLLEQLREALEALDLRPGRVVEALQLRESAEFLEQLGREERRRRESE